MWVITCNINSRGGNNRELAFKEIIAKYFPELKKDMHPQIENACNGLKIIHTQTHCSEIEEYKV